ncbi:MAG: glycosyltransferase family 39 protein [Nitrospiraceae bacterium]|nr:MAG: glycosyltransferase family 39 protein [Nitrospiraceae bacterium]
MIFNVSTVRRIIPVCFVLFLTVIVFLILFTFRFADENRLTSLEWTFSDVDMFRIVLFFLAGGGIAYVLSKAQVPEERPALFLFLTSFAVSMVLWREPEVIVDASRYFTQAKHLELYGISYFIKEWGREIHAWTDLPLVPFLYGLIFKFFGETRIYIQILTSIFFTLTCIITYQIGRTLWDTQTGFLGGLLLMGMPFLLTQVPLMLVDVPTMFFLAFSVFMFINAMEKGKAYIIFSSVALSLAVFSKYSTWLMLSVLAIVVLHYMKHPVTSRKAIFQRGIVIAYISGLLILVPFLFKYDVITGQLSFLREYQVPGLKRWGESFISSFFYQVHPFITVAAFFSLPVALWKRDSRFLIIAWMVLLVILLQIRRARYIMITFPMLALMASYGLQKIQDLELKKFITYYVVLSALVIVIFVYLPFLETMGMANLAHTGRFLDSLEEDEIEVITLPSEKNVINPAVSVPILDLFTSKKISYQYDISGHPPFEKIEKSSLRFTWEYRNPRYYSFDSETVRPRTAALIKSEEVKELPEHVNDRLKGYHEAREFRRGTGIFRFSPQVTVYLFP